MDKNDDSNVKKNHDDDFPLDGPPAQMPMADHATGEIIDPPKKQEVQKVATIQPAQQTGGPLQTFANVLKGKQNALKNFLGNEDNAMKFQSAVIQAINGNSALLSCSPQSLLGAFMEIASLGLYPGNYAGDAYVVPYGGKAQFQIGYRGVKTLAYRSGVIRMGAEVVYSKDHYEEVLGTDPYIKHIKPSFGKARGEPVGAYAWAEVANGKVVFKSMSKDDIMKIKKMSKASGSSHSPWNSNDPMLWMWAKTAFKQLGKLLPTSNDLDRALYLDNVSERGGYIESEGSVIEVAFDDNETKIEGMKSKKQEMRGRKRK